MKNTCPKCGTAYAVNASVVGRTFNCRNCGSALIVAPDGLTYKDAAPAAAPPAAAPPPPPTPAPAAGGGAFNFDEPSPSRRGDDEDRPPKKKKWKRGDEDEPERKRKREEEEEEEDFVPSSPIRRRKTGGGFGDIVAFREFVIPIGIPILFWLYVVLMIIGGIREAEPLISYGTGRSIAVGLGILFHPRPVHDPALPHRV
jgi:hypothetical protein